MRYHIDIQTTVDIPPGRSDALLSEGIEVAVAGLIRERSGLGFTWSEPVVTVALVNEHTGRPVVCMPCSHGEHADDGVEPTCPCCGTTLRLTMVNESQVNQSESVTDSTNREASQ